MAAITTRSSKNPIGVLGTRYDPKIIVSIPMQPDITAVMLRTTIFRMSFIMDVPFENMVQNGWCSTNQLIISISATNTTMINMSDQLMK